MMPDWLPVKLMASPPSSRIAIERSAIEIRSPAESSMSSSRRSGFGERLLASASSSSVVSPIAETTTTTSWPRRLVRTTRSATLRSRSTSATLDPPYFWTTIDIPFALSTRRLEVGGASSPRSVLFKRRDDGRVVARSDLLQHGARGRACGERLADERVVEPPPDVARAHVAPRRPPREQAVVVRIDLPPEIHEAMAQDTLDHRALFGKLADRARLALLRVDV